MNSISAYSQLSSKKVTIHTVDGRIIIGKELNLNLQKEANDVKYISKKDGKIKVISLDSISFIETKKKKIIVARDIEFDNTTNDYQKISSLGEKSHTKFFFLAKYDLFLEVLVEGKINLYRSFLDGISKYFFNPEGVVTPLLYKVYFLPRPIGYLGHDWARSNKFYLQQLRNTMPLFDIKGNLEKPKYEHFHLISYFKKYNGFKK